MRGEANLLPVRLPQEGPYHLLENLGSGSRAKSYLAADRASGRSVVLKVFQGDRTQTYAALQLEYQRASVLLHPYLAEMLDYGVLPSGFFFSTWAHQSGQNLSLLPHALDSEKIAQIGAQIAAALAVIHAAGFVHRDVSPSNILWAPGGAARLIDFDLLVPFETVGGPFAGTPLYAAPEVLRGQVATIKSDLYGLGAVLYFLLVGEGPHNAEGVGDLLRLKEGGLPPWPASIVEGYSRPLLDLVGELLAPSPAARPGNAVDICHRLLAMGTGEPIALGSGNFVPPTCWGEWFESHAQPGVWAWEGETALGRTRCLQEAFRYLRGLGRPVVWVNGARHQEPYGALESLWRWAASRVPRTLETFPRSLARLVASLWPWAFPDVSPLDEPARLARVLPELLRQLLLDVADGQILTVLIDDWDQVDASSREVLQAALQSGWPEFHWLLAVQKPVPFARTLTLDAMKPAQCHTFLNSLTPIPVPEAWVERLCQLAGGRPGWMRQGLLHLLTRSSAEGGVGLPDSLAEIFAGSWSPLGPGARHAMLLLAVCGGQCDWDEWQQMAVLLGADWPLELEKLVSKQLIEPSERGLSFAVGWWLDWIAQQESSARLQRMAADVARILAPAARSTASVHRVACLFAQSDDPRSRLKWASRAVVQAARLSAYETVLEHARDGLDAWEELSQPQSLRSEAQDLWLLQADAWRVLSDLPAASTAYEALLREKLAPDVRGRLLTSLGKCQQMQSEPERAMESLGAAIGLLADTEEHHEHLRALTALGRVKFHTGDRAGSEAVYQEVLRLSRVFRMPAFEADALSFLGTLAVEEPRTKQQGLESLQVALALRETLDDPFGKVDTHMLLGNAFLVLGHLREARHHFESNRALASELGYRSEEGLACLNLALCHAQAGHWSDANEALVLARRLATESRYDFLAAFAAYALSVVASHRADWRLMGEALTVGRALEMKLQSPYVRQFGLVCEAERHLVLGAFEPARRAAVMALDAMKETGGGEWRFKALQCHAEALVLAGDCAEAEEALVPLRELSEGLDTLFSRAALCRLEGLLAVQQQDLSRARLAWEDVRDRAAEGGFDHWHVEAVLALAQLPEMSELLGLDTWQRLQELTGWMGAPLWSLMVGAGAARAHRSLGETLLAERLGRRAQDLLRELTDGLPGAMVRGQFFSHPMRVPWLEALEVAPPDQSLHFSRRLAMLLELSGVLGRSRDPDTVLQLVHAHTLELTRAERCFILLLQVDTTEWRVWPDENQQAYSRSAVNQVLATRKSLCLVDTLEPGNWRPTQSVRDLDLRSVLVVPLASGTTVHGVLYVDSRVALGTFGPDDVSMLEAIASQAAVALETTRLLWALRRQMDQQAAHIRLLAQKDTTISALRDYDRARQVAFEAESHDLRAPLASILVSAQGLLKGLEGPLNPQQVSLLEGLLLNTRLLMTRIDGILDAAVVEAGKLSLRRVRLPFARVVREVLLVLKPIAEAKGLELLWDDHGWDTLPPIWGDARRLNQVVQNLVDNAIKYTPAGLVRVSVSRLQTDVVLTVEDTGPGLPPSRLNAPFARYGPHDPEQHGSGLGLWRVAALVQEHGGVIELQCPPAGGTVVTVRIPPFDETASQVLGE